MTKLTHVETKLLSTNIDVLSITFMSQNPVFITLLNLKPCKAYKDLKNKMFILMNHFLYGARVYPYGTS